MEKIFEIRESKTNEILVDKLPAEQALEVFEAYQNFFGVGSVYITHCVVPQTTPCHFAKVYRNKTAQEYKNDFIMLFAELQEMGNIL